MAVLWQEIGWSDIEEYLQRDNRAIIPMGSCEQHGRHLSFATDYLIPNEIARRVSERTRVPVTPPLCFGMSLIHMDFPGTLSLSPETVVALVGDIVVSLYRHGFRRILLLNGHGDNVPSMNSAIAPLADRFRDLRFKIGNWWEVPEVDRIVRALWGAPEYHATAAETSCIMAVHPGIPKMERAGFSSQPVSLEYQGPAQWRARFPHGAVGVDPRNASPEAGERLLSAAAEHFTRELENWQQL